MKIEIGPKFLRFISNKFQVSFAGITYFIKNCNPKIVNYNPKSEIRNSKWVLLLIHAFVLFFSSCENKNIISEDTFVKIYAEILIAQDTVYTDLKDTTYLHADSFKQKIFMKHNVTKDQYEATLKYYNQNPELWEEFFVKAMAYVENQRKKFDSHSQVKRRGN